jgi:hypothetical protein
MLPQASIGGIGGVRAGYWELSGPTRTASYRCMASRDPRSRPRGPLSEQTGRYSAAVDRIARGEQVLALLEPPAADEGGNAAWLSARLTISQLPRLLLPPCDRRCRGTTHDPSHWVVLADLAIDPADRRDPACWQGWNAMLDERFASGRTWFAGSPANSATNLRVASGTPLRRLTVTDPQFVHYDGAPQETLFRIEEGDHRGDALIAVSFGLSPLLPGLAGVLIAPDHPPARDTRVGVRMLAAGWSAVERGLPHER